MKPSDYNQIHQWLSKNYWKADTCENINCKWKSKLFEYALIDWLSYKRDRDNFMTLCRSCHRIYDYDIWLHNIQREQLSRIWRINWAKNGKSMCKFNIDIINRIKELYSYWLQQRFIARLYNADQSTISLIINNRTYAS